MKKEKLMTTNNILVSHLTIQGKDNIELSNHGLCCGWVCLLGSFWVLCIYMPWRLSDKLHFPERMIGQQSIFSQSVFFVSVSKVIC